MRPSSAMKALEIKVQYDHAFAHRNAERQKGLIV
jgi:hypothetical protein